ncbi:hypothetical protein HYY74_04900 [Candidatus Woesearchaeota archaeon]|nr:hypothetical protein [Candidatus Woesearchaeota archaeon]
MLRRRFFKLLQFVKGHRKRFAAGVIFAFLALLVMILSGLLGRMLAIVGLFILAVLPTLYKRYIRVSIGAELILFCTVLVGVNFGAAAGAVFGALAVMASDLLNRMVGPWSPFQFLGMAAGGLLAGVLGKSLHIVATGLAVFIVVELIRQGPQLVLGDQREKALSAFYTATHLAFNLWLFMIVAPFLGL